MALTTFSVVFIEKGVCVIIVDGMVVVEQSKNVSPRNNDLYSRHGRMWYGLASSDTCRKCCTVMGWTSSFDSTKHTRKLRMPVQTKYPGRETYHATQMMMMRFRKSNCGRRKRLLCRLFANSRNATSARSAALCNHASRGGMMNILHQPQSSYRKHPETHGNPVSASCLQGADGK